MAEFLKERLKNGLTILFERRNLPLTSVLIATRAGAIHETALKKGIAHFSEHMVFKATKTRNALELSSAIERVGGILNAFTADEMTAFWCKIPSKHFSKGMDVISDFVQNPKLDPKDIEAERKVILSEIAMYHDNPQWHIFNKIKELLYRKPFGMPITGSNETVAKINREDFLEWHQYYCPSNLVVSVVGSVKFDDVRDKLKCLGKAAQRFELPKPIVSRKSGNFTEKRAELDQTHFALAMHMPRLSEKARYAGELFNAILGEGMSSKLHNEIREKRGMAYRIHSYLEQEKSYGHAIIYAGIEKKNIKIVKKLTLQEIKKMSKISPKELEEAKEQKIGNWELELEACEKTAANLAMQEITTKAEDFYSYAEKINDVKLQDARALAKIKNYSQAVLVPK